MFLFRFQFYLLSTPVFFPKYFAGDYFQRVFPNGYQHSWPSLFIGAKGTQSDMHVDSGGTNFWLYLLSGKKEWRFFAQDDGINLYRIPRTAKFRVDPFEPRADEAGSVIAVNGPVRPWGKRAKDLPLTRHTPSTFQKGHVGRAVR